MHLTLPELEPHERVELSGPEILRRTIDLKLERLRRGRESTLLEITATAARLDQLNLHVARDDSEIAAWEHLSRWIADTTEPCSLCRGEGCSFACGRPQTP